MRIDNITLRGFKGVNGTFPLGDLTLFKGANGSGKSAVLEGMYFAVTGVLPGGRALKHAAQWMSGDIARVDVVTSAGGFGRAVRKTKTGFGSDVYVNNRKTNQSHLNDWLQEHFGSIQDIMRPSTFMARSATEKRQYIVDLLVATGRTPDGFGDPFAAVRKELGDMNKLQTEIAPALNQERFSQLVDWLQECKQATGASDPIAQMGQAIDYAKERQNHTRQLLTRQEDRFSGMVQSAFDPEALRQVEDEINETDAALQDEQDTIARIETIAGPIKAIEQSIDRAKDRIFAATEEKAFWEGNRETATATLKSIDESDLDEACKLFTKAKDAREKRTQAQAELDRAVKSVEGSTKLLTVIAEDQESVNEKRENYDSAMAAIGQLIAGKFKGEAHEQLNAALTAIDSLFCDLLDNVEQAIVDEYDSLNQSIARENGVINTLREHVAGHDEIIGEHEATGNTTESLAKRTREVVGLKDTITKADKIIELDEKQIAEDQESIASDERRLSELMDAAGQNENVEDVRQRRNVLADSLECLRAKRDRLIEQRAQREQYDDLNGQIQWGRAFLGFAKAVIAACDRVRNRLVKQLVRHATRALETYMPDLMDGTPYMRLTDDLGKSSFDVGVKLKRNNGTEAWISVDAMSEGETCVFLVAFGAMLAHLSNKPHALMLIETDGCDDNTLSYLTAQLLMTVSNWDGLQSSMTIMFASNSKRLSVKSDRCVTHDMATAQRDTPSALSFASTTVTA